MLLYAELHVSELVDLDVQDVEIHPRSGNIMLRVGKDGQPREVGLSKQVRESLIEWFKLCKEMGVKDQALFVDLKRNFSRLTVRSIRNMLEEASRRPGIEVTPHILRHTYAYMLRKNGTQPEVRVRLMGHSIDMVLRYSSPKEEEMNKAVDSLDQEMSF